MNFSATILLDQSSRGCTTRVNERYYLPLGRKQFIDGQLCFAVIQVSIFVKFVIFPVCLSIYIRFTF